VLKRIEWAKKTTGTVNSLLWSKYI
jgi:hypothetical protein